MEHIQILDEKLCYNKLNLWDAEYKKKTKNNFNLQTDTDEIDLHKYIYTDYKQNLTLQYQDHS